MNAAFTRRLEALEKRLLPTQDCNRPARETESSVSLLERLEAGRRRVAGGAEGCRHRLKSSRAMLKRGVERLSKSCTPGATDQQWPIRRWWRRAACPPGFHNRRHREHTDTFRR
jgi:hypothetical protein